MKTFKLFAWTIAACLAFAACSDDDGTTDPDGKVYKVTVTADANGTAVADPAETEAGETVTLRATANEGFSFAGWSVESGNVTLANASAPETTFTMPKGDVAVKATFVEGGEVIADILPLLKDSGIKEYAELRMTSPQQIEGKNYGGWDIVFDGKLTSAEAAQVKAMNLTDCGVTSLEDLQYFPNLEVLLISGNDLQKGLDIFKKLPALTILKGEKIYTPEGSLIDLTGCPELATVSFHESYVYNVDLSNNPKLNDVDLFYTFIDKLDLSASTLLTRLDATLAENLTSLDVSHCTALQILSVATCPDLTDLKLPKNSRLTNLDVYNTAISELDATQHPLLTRLSCGTCPNLTKLDVSKCTKLVQLACSYSPVGKLDLSNCPEMDLLRCYCCRLTELNLKNCSKLFEVYCHHNNLTELDATDLGFWFDDEKGEMTNTYSLYCGEQVAPGDEPGLDREFELKYELWDAVAKPITVYLRPDQMEYWEPLSETPKNYLATAVEVN